MIGAKAQGKARQRRRKRLLSKGFAKNQATPEQNKKNIPKKGGGF